MPGLERKKIDNFKHFEEEYAPDQKVVQFVVGGITLLPDEVPMQMADQIESKKPLEWLQRYFANQDSNFAIGLRVHKRGPQSMWVMAKYEQSDIIIASPQGLNKVNEGNLSSLHTVIIDSIDWILDSQQKEFIKQLQRLHVRPGLIVDQNITSIGKPYLEGVPEAVCQFITF